MDVLELTVFLQFHYQEFSKTRTQAYADEREDAKTNRLT